MITPEVFWLVFKSFGIDGRLLHVICRLKPKVKAECHFYLCQSVPVATALVGLQMGITKGIKNLLRRCKICPGDVGSSTISQPWRVLRVCTPQVESVD